MFWGRKKDVPWEVVGFRIVESVPMYDEDDDDLTITHMATEDMSRIYVFDITKSKHFRNALVFARQLLIQEVSGLNYNLLLTEGWEFTLLRRGKEYRAQVRYSGRPAYSEIKPSQHNKRPRSPPFIGVLDTCGD